MRDPSPSTHLVRLLPLAGAVFSALAVAAFFLLVARSQTQALSVLAGLAVLAYGGKEAALPVGIASGAHPILMGAFIFLVDAAITCFLYPPIHYAIRSWLAKDNLVGRYLRYVRKDALHKRGLVAKYGTFGLFLFMLLPFAVNGPLVGAVLGRTMGLRARQIVPTLILAIGVTTVLWTTIYGLGFLVIASLDPALPQLIALGVVAIVLVHAIIVIRRVRREENGEVLPTVREPLAPFRAGDAVPEPTPA